MGSISALYDKLHPTLPEMEAAAQQKTKKLIQELVKGHIIDCGPGITPETVFKSAQICLQNNKEIDEFIWKTFKVRDFAFHVK